MARTIATLGVLAGAYVRQDDKRSCLTHAVEVDDRPGRVVRVLCGRVKLDNVCPDGYTADEEAEAPTCVACARRDPRRAGAVGGSR